MERFIKIYDVSGVTELNKDGSRRQKILSNARSRLEGGSKLYVGLENDNEMPIGGFNKLLLYTQDFYSHPYVVVSSSKGDADSRPIGIVGTMPQQFLDDIKNVFNGELEVINYALNFSRFYEFTHGKKTLLGCSVEFFFWLTE
ncbi:MAG: hypothetical protein LBN96_06915 [Desulfovibrio sp.]|jgi:hypothetical protein|nr:hypothetical protein [Desulfovibrio sp.]